ncbi:hypothetical protein M5D96_003216 [Drosophila gunungcola]|uniref:Uncharacterized protein n=2 Tax=elegans subgroup (in: flies) TaxID=32348 RepID=A0A9P9YRU6_9MUSC|nr:hypothetical protein M5D96_003216 [Drosophila gunungcola]
MRSFIEENEKNDPLINAPDKKNNPSQVSGRNESLDLVPVEMQHYNNNYYYYYNYNLSYEPPEDRSMGGGGVKRGGRRLQQLVRRTRYELQQWPLLMQLVLFVLWLNAKFWQLVNEQVTYRRRRWH